MPLVGTSPFAALHRAADSYPSPSFMRSQSSGGESGFLSSASRSSELIAPREGAVGASKLQQVGQRHRRQSGVDRCMKWNLAG